MRTWCSIDFQIWNCISDLKCEPPEIPIHGYVTGSASHIGSKIDIGCDDGYIIQGPSVKTCLAVPNPFKHMVQWDPSSQTTCISKYITYFNITSDLFPVAETSRFWSIFPKITYIYHNGVAKDMWLHEVNISYTIDLRKWLQYIRNLINW